MADGDDQIWLACLAKRPVQHRVAISAEVYFTEGADHVPGMGRAEVEAVMRDFLDDLLRAGWHGPHPPGRGPRRIPHPSGESV